MTDLKIEQQILPDLYILKLTGHLDSTSATELRDHLSAIATSGSAAIIDLTQLDQIDSAGLAVLMVAHKRFGPPGPGFVIVCNQDPGSKIWSLFTVTNLTRVFTFADSDAAISYLKEPS